MKKLYLFALVATIFTSCINDTTQEVAIEVDTPETLTVSFEDDTRIRLDNEQKTVWTKDDLVSVFYRSNANQKWQFQGETGDRIGTLKRVANAEATQEISDVVVVYPYNQNYYINPKTCNIQASLPATQTYLANSYGLNGNIMVSQSEYNQIALKSVCGWLKLQLTGDGEVIESIALKGNNGEQVAGEIYINSADATCTLAAENGASDDDSVAGGNLVFDDTILTEVTLDCSEGVTLGAEATAFYIALPPQTFENGLTVVFTNSNGVTFEKSTEKAVVIERNTIQPMEAFAAEFPVPVQQNNEIWYTSSNGNIVSPSATNVFGVKISSNTYKNGKGIITFDADITQIGGSAFNGCTTLTSISIPCSVITIKDGAFKNCSSLKHVNYTGDLSDWCKITFEGSYGYSNPLINKAKLYINGIEATDLTIPSDIKEIKPYTFTGCNSLVSITISNNVTKIGYYAFRNCNSLKNVSIGNCVTSIDQSAFEYCTNLTSVTIPNSVKSIGQAAFYMCSSLASIEIPNSITKIQDETFTGCSSLTSVTIPDSVTSIGWQAFYACSKLERIYCKATTPPAGGSSMFSSIASAYKIYVPYESVTNYKSASYWSDYANQIEGYNF